MLVRFDRFAKANERSCANKRAAVCERPVGTSSRRLSLSAKNRRGVAAARAAT
jgi:hypothetical protein